MRLEMASPSPAPSKCRAFEPSPCSKSSKIAARRSLGTPGPGVDHLEQQPPVARRLDADADAAAVGEFDGVAGEIGQHLAQPQTRRRRTKRGDVGGDRGGDFQALALRARRQQFDDALDERRRSNGS